MWMLVVVLWLWILSLVFYCLWFLVRSVALGWSGTPKHLSFFCRGEPNARVIVLRCSPHRASVYLHILAHQPWFLSLSFAPPPEYSFLLVQRLSRRARRRLRSGVCMIYILKFLFLGVGFNLWAGDTWFLFWQWPCFWFGLCGNRRTVCGLVSRLNIWVHFDIECFGFEFWESVCLCFVM